MLGSDLLTRAARILQDEDHVRWTLVELSAWANDAMRAIMLAKPSALSNSTTLNLVAGTLQKLTNANQLLLLRVARNIVSVGPPLVGGRAIRVVDREILDASEPNWHVTATVPFSKTVARYIYDEQNPREWYCYPGNDGTGIVEAIVSLMPTMLTASGNPALIASYATELGLPEPYPLPMLDYVVYRALTKDDTAADPARAAVHLQAFMSALGIKAQAEAGNSPNARARATAITTTVPVSK